MRGGKEFIHELTRNLTKEIRTFVCFLRDVSCEFVDKVFRPAYAELTLGYDPIRKQIQSANTAPVEFFRFWK